ncbi:hypothetical protein Tco_0848668 [Tanacetum coccineum]
MMSPDLTCPSTSQLLWSISLVLARASLVAISKLLSSFGSSEGDYTSSVIIRDAVLSGQYAVLNLQNTLYCLEEHIRCLDYRDQYAILSGKVDTPYPTGGYGASVDLSEHDTKKTII